MRLITQRARRSSASRTSEELGRGAGPGAENPTSTRCANPKAAAEWPGEIAAGLDEDPSAGAWSAVPLAVAADGDLPTLVLLCCSRGVKGQRCLGSWLLWYLLR